MAIDITTNIVYRVKADGTREASKGFDAVAKAADNAALEVVSLGDAGAKSTSLLSKLGDVGRSGLDKLASGLESAKGGVSGMLGGVDSLAKAMAPWNQALELGGKAIKFATEGMDAYAKTSPAAAAAVREIKDEFGKLKDNAMAAVGEITVSVLKPIPNLQQLEEQLKATARAGGDLKKAAEESARAWAFVRSIATGKFIGDALGTNDPWAVTPSGKDAFDAFTKWFNEQKAKQAAAAAKTAPKTDTAGKPMGWSKPSAPAPTMDRFMEQLDLNPKSQQGALSADQVDAAKALNEQLTQAAAATGVFADNTAKVATALETVKGPTLLEKLGLDDPSGWDIAAAGVQAFSSAWASSLEALATSSESTGTIFKRGLGVIVHALADKLAAFSAAEAVEAAAHLALLDFSGAARHGAAAGVYALGAGLAYGAASKLGASGGTVAKPAASGAASAGSASTGSGGSAGSASSGESARPIYVLLGSAFDETTPRQRSVRAKEAVEKALRERDE
jgi:hypothetical protein